MKTFIIESRYEAMKANGKEFTKWFTYKGKPMTKEEAEDIIREAEDLNKKMKIKMKHEYRLRDSNEYKKEYEKTMSVIMEAKKRQDAYYKSEEYKELQRKKRKSAKELKEKQKKYKIEHQFK